MCTRLWRAPIFTLLNIVMLLSGIAGIFISIFHLKGSVLYECPQCSIYSQVFIGFCSFACAVGLLGLCAQELHSKIILIFHKFGIFLLFLAVLAVSLCVVLVKFGSLNGFLQLGWERAVTDKSPIVCEFQQLFHCTGWSHSCLYNITADGHTKKKKETHSASILGSYLMADSRDISTASEQEPYMEEVDVDAILPEIPVSWIPIGGHNQCPTCNETADNRRYNFSSFESGQTCRTVVVGSIDNNFRAIIIGCCVTVLVILFMNCLAYRAGRKYSYIYDEEDFEDGSPSAPLNSPGQRKNRYGGPPESQTQSMASLHRYSEKSFTGNAARPVEVAI